MITDRRRFGPSWRDDLPAAVADRARAGVQLVQVRERDLDGLALFELVKACVAAVRGTGTRIVVNDRADVALAAGAHGVHLRADSFPAGRLRAIAPRPWLVGRSVHALDDARAAAGEGELDYLLFGTVFPTASKPGRRAAGLDALAQVAAAVTLPVLAVGGMTEARIAEVCRNGAAGAAGIGMFAPLTPPGA
jgi:thiamine-phosphate pyrophosphorylase